MAANTICSDFGAQKNKIWHCLYCFPSISHEVMGLDAMILVFYMLSFKPTFSLSSFTFIRRLLSSSSLSAIRMMSSAYLRLLIFIPAILITQNLSQYFKKCTLRTYHVTKIGTRLQICKGTDVENTKWGRRGSWIKWEIGIDIYTLLCLQDASLVVQC